MVHYFSIIDMYGTYAYDSNEWKSGEYNDRVGWSYLPNNEQLLNLQVMPVIENDCAST